MFPTINWSTGKSKTTVAWNAMFAEAITYSHRENQLKAINKTIKFDIFYDKSFLANKINRMKKLFKHSLNSVKFYKHDKILGAIPMCSLRLIAHWTSFINFIMTSDLIKVIFFYWLKSKFCFIIQNNLKTTH